MPTLALLDGHSLAYRAFYALPEDLATQSGQVTNSVYGFARMLIRLLKDHPVDGLAVAWDVGRRTFRTDEYPEYKAQREKAPDTFRSQLPLIDEVLDSLGITQFRMEGYEADDIIGSLATSASDEGWDVLIVTGDRDAFQLVNDRVKVVYTRRGISDIVMADEPWVTERYGISPAQYVDYAALRGDTSDNLPGVPGVGEKTAARLVASYGTLESIYEHLDEMTPKLRENLEAASAQAFLNRHLMQLILDLDTGAVVDELTWTNWDLDRMKVLFQSLEFHSLFDELMAVHPDGAPEVEALDVEVVIPPGQEMNELLSRMDRIAFDPLHEGGELVGVVIAVDDETAAFLPIDRIDEWSPFFTDEGVPKTAHDAKGFVREMLARNLEVHGLDLDTALAAYLIDPAARSFELRDLADRYLGLEVESPDTEASGGSQGAFDFSGGPDLEAAGRRAVVLRRLSGALMDELDTRSERPLFDEVEIPLLGVLARMEVRGVGIDRKYLEGLGDDLRAQLADLEVLIHEAAGGPFNINSTLQLREVLYDRLDLPVLKKTSKGAPSTDASVLKKLGDAHPIVEHLLRYRELEKLRSTYVDGYLPLIAADGRIHTSFNQIAASTGRLSSDNPNLQNIPVRSETGRLIRRAFVPEAGWTFVVADYSQIELRILAHLSGDPGLLEAFKNDQDIHTATAARVFGRDLDDVPVELRRRAKAINFGLLYGMEAFGLADRLEITREEATEHIDAYFAQFPDVRAFMDSVVVDAKRLGYTETLFGRRRYLPELKSDNFRIRQMGERMALNAPIQGAAADIIKKAMVELDTRLAGLESRMLLQIHDELVLEVPPDEMTEATGLLVSTMESVVELSVPLRVDVSNGANLAECKG
ncbi:MAG: DNA polymerase I [Acidimicrobiia bacterium]|nr:DNA polymerase I [Acidimicrobiia bacterium]